MNMSIFENTLTYNKLLKDDNEYNIITNELNTLWLAKEDDFIETYLKDTRKINNMTKTPINNNITENNNLTKLTITLVDPIWDLVGGAGNC